MVLMALTPAALNRINRIRLEFKGELEGIKMALKRVLIESDWNLKNRVQFTDFL